MLSGRRNETDSNLGYTPSRPTNNYVGGGQSLTLVTHEKPFRASISQSVETLSPQSPSRGGGPRQPSVRANTDETLSPASESTSQPQPQNTTPISHPTSTPGEDVGKSTTPPHWSGYEDPDQYTAGNSYRFDATPPPPPSNSGPPCYNPADISGGAHARVWPVYNRVSEEFDKTLFSKQNEDLGTLMVFGGLFTAVVITALTTALGNLQPDYQQQSALLLYQLLNGRDPSLASLSDPTAPFKPSVSSVTIVCFWVASLLVSLGASYSAMICKQWQNEYNCGADLAFDFLRACRRQAYFKSFRKLNTHATTIIPLLLKLSINLFAVGVAIYLWQIDKNLGIVFVSFYALFYVAHLALFPTLPQGPFRPFSMLLINRLTVVIGKRFIALVDPIVHRCFLVRRYVTGAILDSFAQTTLNTGALRNRYTKARSILPGEYKHMRVWWDNAFDYSLNQIDTGPQAQEEAILWLSQKSLDPSQSVAVVSSLALMSSSRPHKFPESAVVFLNSVLESSCREAPSPARIDCVLVLSRIMYQSVVDQNQDKDHTIGGLPVTPLVAYAAQQLTISAFKERSNTPHSEGIRVRLLAAAAWLSPVNMTEEGTPKGEKPTIQDRWEFVKEIEVTLERHIHGEKPLDNGVLVDLIHGLHACIPRGDYGSKSFTPFLLPICEDRSSSWSEDESVLKALITYALDLLSYPKRNKPLVARNLITYALRFISYSKREEQLVERDVKFDELALELIDTLMVSTGPAEVAVFGFWLISRVPYAFRSRKSILTDIILTWTLTDTNEQISEDLHRQLNFHAASAFVAVTRYHLIAEGKLPKLVAHRVLSLLKAALKDSCSKPMATHALALILKFGTPTQSATLLREINAETRTDILDPDLEKNPPEEETLDLYIHTTLLLPKLQPPQVDVGTERMKALIGKMEGKMEDPDIDNRMRWKAIYLSGLLVQLLPQGERNGRTERLRGKVQAVLQSKQLPLADDYEHCLKPLGVGWLELGTSAEREGASFKIFEKWINDFPLA